MTTPFMMVGKIKPISVSNVGSLEWTTRRRLEGVERVCYQTTFDFDRERNVSLLTQPPTPLYFGSSNPDIGAVVQAEEMLPSKGLVSQGGLRGLWYKIFPYSPPWVGIYQKV